MDERHGGCIQTLVVKPEGNRQITRLGIRGQANIKMYLKENKCKGVGWVFLVPSRDHWCPFSSKQLRNARFHKIIEFLDHLLDGGSIPSS
jgi:hypothetical protein